MANSFNYKRWTDGFQPKRYLTGNAAGCIAEFRKKVQSIRTCSKQWGRKIEERIMTGDDGIHMRKWNSANLSAKLLYGKSAAEVAEWLMEGKTENPPEDIGKYIGGFDWSDPKANETLQARFNEWKSVKDVALKDVVHAEKGLEHCYTAFRKQ